MAEDAVVAAMESLAAEFDAIAAGRRQPPVMDLEHAEHQAFRVAAGRIREGLAAARECDGFDESSPGVSSVCACGHSAGVHEDSSPACQVPGCGCGDFKGVLTPSQEGSKERVAAVNKAAREVFMASLGQQMSYAEMEALRAVVDAILAPLAAVDDGQIEAIVGDHPGIFQAVLDRSQRSRQVALNGLADDRVTGWGTYWLRMVVAVIEGRDWPIAGEAAPSPASPADWSYTCDGCGWHTKDTRYEQHTCRVASPAETREGLEALTAGQRADLAWLTSAQRQSSMPAIRHAAFLAGFTAAASPAELLRIQDVVHDDLSDLLTALGMGTYARPYSSHDLMQEAIAKVRDLRAAVSPAETREGLEALTRMREALRLIAAGGCSNQTSGRCSDDPNRSPIAQYGAEKWCDECIAAHALAASPAAVPLPEPKD